MLTTWVRPSAITLAALGTALLSTPAWADTSAALRSGQTPTTAVAYALHGCDQGLGGGPLQGQDVWIFVLPDRTRDFTGVTAVFDTNGDGVGDTTLSTPAAGGVQGGSNGTSKGWIIAPAGAALLDASAVVTGDPADGEVFNINQTCPAAGSPSGTPSPVPSPPAHRPSASPIPSSVGVVLPGVARTHRAGRGAGVVDHPEATGTPSADDSTDAIVGEMDSGETPDATLGASPQLAAAVPSSDGADLGLTLFAGSALLAAAGCAAVLFVIRRRISTGERLRKVGRHHLAPDGK
jgi:hypothetical protein